MTPEDKDYINKRFSTSVSFGNTAARLLWLQGLKVGDMVVRVLGTLRMQVLISKIEGDLLYVVPTDERRKAAAEAAAKAAGFAETEVYWTFSRKTGAEIDESLGWTEHMTGSYIIPLRDEATYHRVAKAWEHYKTGDSGTVGEELLQGVDPIEEKCFVVEKAIREDYFTEEEALAAYQLSREDYHRYLKPKQDERQ